MNAILRVPLLGKLLGANLLVVLAALVVHFVRPTGSMLVEMIGALVASFAVNGALAWLALRPVAQLEDVAERVSAGDFDARVPLSRLADRNMERLAATMNRLLDRVHADRARIQYLAGRSVRARDIERENVAHELRESMAQTSAAIAMQLALAKGACSDPTVLAAVDGALESVQQLTEEMRSVAETIYPGTLGELGLLNAIQALARRVSRRSGLRISVDCGLFDTQLPATITSALYRVADEALANVERHGQAEHARVVLATNGSVSLEVEDDGRGIDMKQNDPMQAGLGLFSANVVLALVGGGLQISSAPGKGTRVTARVPLGNAIRAA